MEMTKRMNDHELSFLFLLESTFQSLLALHHGNKLRCIDTVCFVDCFLLFLVSYEHNHIDPILLIDRGVG